MNVRHQLLNLQTSLQLSSTFLFLMVMLVSTTLFAQVNDYGNAWIDYDQTYYKVKVGRDGLYRIPTSVLQANGIPTEGEGLKMVYQGEEIPIYVTTAGTMGEEDYVEFVGKRNDGLLDSRLYLQASHQPYVERSLFSDTATYFLFWNNEGGDALHYQTANNEVSNPPSAETHFDHQALRVMRNAFHRGRPIRVAGVNENTADYEAGEGMSSVIIEEEGNLAVNVLTPSVYLDAGANADVEIKFLGNSTNFGVAGDNHHVEVSIDGIPYHDATYKDYNVLVENFELPLTTLSTTTFFEVTSLADISAIDKNRVAYIKVDYPHTFDFNNQQKYSFSLDNDSDKYLEINNFDGGEASVLYDLTTAQRYVPVIDNSSGQTVYQFLIPQTGEEEKRQFYFSSTSNEGFLPALYEVENLLTRTFTDYSQPENQGDFLMVSHPRLRTGEVDEVARYVDYRRSADGGNYQVVLADMEELYDQFAWGIAKHPLAVRHLVNYALLTWEQTPEYLLLLGQAVGYDKVLTAATDEKYNRCLVPTYGERASDAMLSVNNIFTYKSQLATGRIPANSPDQVRLYLDKLQEYETNLSCTDADRLWQKHAVHLVGGSNIEQSEQFLATLNAYKAIYEDKLMGGQVVGTFNKLTDMVISAADLGDYINPGLNLITFLGHSSGDQLNVDLGPANSYDNEGKYPFILTGSCFIGDIHDYQEDPADYGMSKDYLLTEDRGAIGFLATTAAGIPVFLDEFMGDFYRTACKDYPEKPTGFAVQFAIERMFEEFNINPSLTAKNTSRLTCQTYTFAGDPAVRLAVQQQADYAIYDADVTFNPPQLTTDLDGFDINIRLTNFGQALADSINITIQQTLPNGTMITVAEQRIAAPIYQDSLMIYVPMGETEDVEGSNVFTISVDSDNAVAEVCETDNVVTRSQDILSDLLIPVAPCFNAVVNSTSTTLYASTGLPIVAPRNYRFELDTTTTFNSPLLQTETLLSASGMLEWDVTDLQNKTTYYWRTAIEEDNPTWKQSSFTVIEGGSEAWMQAHFYQVQENRLEGMSLNPTTRMYAFDEAEHSVNIYNNRTSLNTIGAFADGMALYEESCLTSTCAGGLAFMVIKPTLELNYLTTNRETGFGCEGLGTYGNLHCDNAEHVVIEFNTSDATQRANLVNFVETEIEEGDYVVLYSVQTHGLQSQLLAEYNGEMSIFFESIGLAELINVPDSEAFIAIGQKGNDDFEPTFLNVDADTTFNLSKSFITKNRTATIRTPNIGGAKNWQAFYWEFDQWTANDAMDLAIYGGSGGSFELLETLDNITVANSSYDLSFIDATVYPFLQIQATLKDSIDFTPVQLNNWEVRYERYPEVGVNYQAQYSITDTLQEGETVHFELAITNPEAHDFENLPIQYILVDANNESHILETEPIEIIPAGETVIATLDYPTTGYVGNNQLLITLNPEQTLPEKFDFNNNITASFFVENDKINPVVDVTVDGQHILDGDIINPNPTIVLKVKDENRFLALNDTANFRLSLKRPQDSGPLGQASALYFAQTDIEFVPANANEASGGENIAEIRYTPEYSEDGLYQLFFFAEDRSGNNFDVAEYSIAYNIVTNSAVSKLMNYPNPFTSSTQFLFTLTGSEIPDFFKIQILTISGKVVREITQSELGTLKIGRNVTEYAWDGTDEFGTPLGNGVYLYRVIAHLNGEELDNYETGADAYFNDYQIGKMYLMR